MKDHLSVLIAIGHGRPDCDPFVYETEIYKIDYSLSHEANQEKMLNYMMDHFDLDRDDIDMIIAIDCGMVVNKFEILARDEDEFAPDADKPIEYKINCVKCAVCLEYAPSDTAHINKIGTWVGHECCWNLMESE